MYSKYVVTDIAEKYVVCRIGVGLGWFAPHFHLSPINVLDWKIVSWNGDEALFLLFSYLTIHTH